MEKKSREEKAAQE